MTENSLLAKWEGKRSCEGHNGSTDEDFNKGVRLRKVKTCSTFSRYKGREVVQLYHTTAIFLPQFCQLQQILTEFLLLMCPYST